MTMDGVTHDVGKWDLLIAHPPCTYLSNAATRSYSLRVTPAEKVVSRWAERVKAAVFFMRFALADVPKIAVENPVGIMNTAYRKADQIIYPYYFAENEDDVENYHTKRTCLWLKNLPPLKRKNSLPPPEPVYISNGKKEQENWMVRGHSRNSKRPRGPGKSQKQNRAGHCKGNVRTMGVMLKLKLKLMTTPATMLQFIPRKSKKRAMPVCVSRSIPSPWTTLVSWCQTQNFFPSESTSSCKSLLEMAALSWYPPRWWKLNTTKFGGKSDD